MKHLALISFCLLISYVGSAQFVDADEKPMSKGIFQGFSVTVEDADTKSVEREWQQFMKDYSGKSKRSRRSGEITTTGAAIGGLTGDVVVYGSATDIGSSVRFTAWYETDAVFITANEVSEGEIINGIMERFIVHMKRVAIENELLMEEKALKEFQKDLKQAEKSEQRSHEEIARFEKKIAEAEASIEESVQMQVQKAAEIETQQRVIESVRVRLNNVSLAGDASVSPEDDNDGEEDNEKDE